MDIGHPSEIAKRLKAERERLGLTLGGMAEAAQIGRATQANYEAAITAPGVDYVYRLKAIGVDTHFLLTGVKASEVLNASHPELLWMAAQSTLKMNDKFAHLPGSELGLGMLFVKFFRLYEGADSALTEQAGLLPVPKETSA